ncbi:DUF2865 domain-containing protein [Rhabdaerophilum sp. SD176]|uniref:DUF2865 domain-containing protein n=1 Tax=Rhabdaerophilum sp. SD176 TaxID=2983548 RepID=UPI0024E00BC3|nr:DUF2865 domain-containing protein [Rhabdaerophilum sp. SD176]
MILFPPSGSNHTLWTTRKAAVLASGVVVAVGTGTLLVKAADNPRLHRMVSEINRPVRAAVEPLLVRPERALVEVSRAREMQKLEVLRVAARPPVPAPAEPRATAVSRPMPPAAQVAARPTVVLPSAALPRNAVISEPVPAVNPLWPPKAGEAPAGTPRPRIKLQARGLGQGMPMPTNYCVRLCDGFAFPIGQTGVGQQVQEVVCRSACPGAETALYTLPAGARDLAALSRGGAPYTRLPTAFRYQRQVSQACSCRPMGSTQSANAFYRDLTLKRGDVIMTGSGAQHFDGASRFPYQPRNFGEAVKRLSSPREITIIRAMEVASVRGAFSPLAPSSVRARVIADLQTADRKVRGDVPNPSPIGHPKGFVELQARTAEGRSILPVVRRTPGLVVLN